MKPKDVLLYLKLLNNVPKRCDTKCIPWMKEMIVLILFSRYPKWPNNADFIQMILHRENFDDDFTLGSTRSGAPKLLYRGHMFYRWAWITLKRMCGLNVSRTIFSRHKDTIQQRAKGKIVRWHCIQGQAKSSAQSGINCKVSSQVHWSLHCAVLYFCHTCNVWTTSNSQVQDNSYFLHP